MGVDAEMFVRLRGKSNWFSDDYVKRLSYEIGTSCGKDTFFTMNPSQGVFGDRKRRALEVIEPLTSDGAADYGTPEHVGKVVWFQDGEPIIAEPDEQFVKVNLYSRYYGKNYERGSWPMLRAVILWLHIRLPNGEVWYGGDSSGCVAEHASMAFVADMDLHWATSGRRPYVRYKVADSTFGGLFPRMPKDDIAPPVCQLCEVPMAESGGSSDYSFYFCDGCGAKASAHVNGTVAWAKLHEDFPYFDNSGTPVTRKEEHP